MRKRMRNYAKRIAVITLAFSMIMGNNYLFHVRAEGQPAVTVELRNISAATANEVGVYGEDASINANICYKVSNEETPDWASIQTTYRLTESVQGQVTSTEGVQQEGNEYCRTYALEAATGYKVHLMITPSEGYEAEVSGNNYTNTTPYVADAAAGANQYISLNIKQEGGGGQPQPQPQETTLYLAWNGGTQTITVDATNNTFIVPSTCDFASLKIYAIESGQEAGVNDLCLNDSNKANSTTDTIRSWHVTDYWQEPILDDDDTNNDHPITQFNINCAITLIKESAKAVSLEYPNEMIIADGWEFGNVQITDLNDATTVDSAMELEAYYQNTKIGIVDPTGAEFTSVKPLNVPSGAVTVSGQGTQQEPFLITFNSDFYDAVVFEVTTANGEVRYLKIVRKGIEIRLYSSINGANGTNTLHGTQPGCAIDWSDQAEEKIIATFYYPTASSSTDYQMVAAITYEDGTTETKVVSGTAGLETNSVGNATKGGDYLIWSGDKSSRPVSVSVTAVKAGSFVSDNSTFAGASFGSGAGVVWTDITK